MRTAAGTAIFALAALLSGGLASGRPAAAETTLSYRGYLGGVPIGAAQVAVAIEKDRYRATANLETVGAIAWMFPWRTQAQTHGSIRGKELAPERHASEGTFRDKPRSMGLRFAPNGLVAVEAAVPSLDDPTLDTVPVPIEATRGAFDPLSHFLQVAMQVSRTGRCGDTLPVFDGRRRFDLAYSEGVTVRQRTSVFAPNGGSALRCDIAMHRVAGWKPRPQRSLEDQPAPELPAQIWLRPHPSLGIHVPIRIEIETRVATLIMHLTDPVLPEG